MKISALIIAHNEEEGIAGTIESLLAQRTVPDEIVVIAHNSSDATAEIARTYPVRVVAYTGPAGPAYARIKGFEEVTGDMVLCIDGDSLAAPNWVEELSSLLAKPDVVLAGSWVRMYGTLYAHTCGPRWYFFCNSHGAGAVDWLFGASFGFMTRNRTIAIEALKAGIEYSNQLGLPVNPDDYWLALHMAQHGTVSVTNKTWVRARAKEKTSLDGIKRGWVATFLIRKRIHAFLRRGGMKVR